MDHEGAATPPLRLLAFSDVAWPEGTGGVERTLARIYPWLAARARVSVRLVALAQGDGAIARDEWRDGVRIRRCPRLPLERLTGLQAALSLDAWRVGLGLARRWRPDVVHAHTLFFHTSLVALVAARLAGAPLLLTVHVGALDALPQPGRLLATLYEQTLGRLLLRAADRIICVSDDVRRHALALGAAPERVVMIPNGVEAARFACPPRPPRAPVTLVCVGRLIVNKGPHDLIAAVARLRARGLTVRLRLAGDGPAEGSLRRLVAAHGLDAQVDFLGPVADVPALLAASDVFVRPSLTEGMSLAVLEAMAAGMAIVVSDVSGNRQVIDDGVSGLITPPGDVAALTAALARVVADPALRARLGAAAARRAADYDWERVAAATAKEVRDAVR